LGGIAVSGNFPKGAVKMKKTFFLSIVLVTGLLVACGRGAQETPTPTQAPSPTPTQALEEIPTESALEAVAVSEILDISWQWAAQFMREPASQSVVPDPQSYTLVFHSDGSFAVQADCNSGSGTYTADGSNIDLIMGPLTLVACGPDSLSEMYLTMLGEVGSFGMQEGVLVLVTQDGNSLNSFTNGGMATPAGMSLGELSPLGQEALVDIHWKLITVYETASATQLSIPETQEYSLVFRENGEIEVKADCNTAQGTYEVNSDQMGIILGPTTLAECGPESLSSSFLDWLGQVTAL
jgi:heat shock protein HslJ